MWFASLNNGKIPLKYTCSSVGEEISPPISWKRILKSATHLKIIVEDATCIYMCNDCCKYHHFHCIIPLDDKAFAGGIAEGANKSANFQPFILDNSSNEKKFIPFFQAERVDIYDCDTVYGLPKK